MSFSTSTSLNSNISAHLSAPEAPIPCGSSDACVQAAEANGVMFTQYPPNSLVIACLTNKSILILIVDSDVVPTAIMKVNGGKVCSAQYPNWCHHCIPILYTVLSHLTLDQYPMGIFCGLLIRPASANLSALSFKLMLLCTLTRRMFCIQDMYMIPMHNFAH